jgi:hypothetical protein
MSLFEHGCARKTERAAKIEKIMLCKAQRRGDLRPRPLREDGANLGIQLINIAKKSDPRVGLRNARSVPKRGLALVAAARDDSIETVRDERSPISPRACRP